MNVGELLKTANRLKREGQLDEAIALYHQVIEINPNFSWAYHNLGDAFAKQGKLDEAVAEYYKAVEINPNSAWIFYCLGETLIKQGELETAVEYFQKAINIQSDFYRFYQGLGLVLIFQKKFDEAIANYNKAIELNSKVVHSYIGYCLSLLSKGELNQAQYYLQQALKTYPKNPSVKLYCDFFEILEKLATDLKLKNLKDISNLIDKHSDWKQYSYNLNSLLELVKIYEKSFNQTNLMIPKLDRFYHGITELVLPGEDYIEVLRNLHFFLKPKTYIEIGIQRGESFKLATLSTISIGIDPQPQLMFQVLSNSKIFATTSDEFFQNYHLLTELDNNKVDFAFIDGLHLFEQALKDFINLEKYSHQNTVICLHDTLPLDEITSRRERVTRFWSGDVWKIVPILKKYRPDLEIYTVATKPTGLTIVTNLDNNSKTLSDYYDNIVEEYIDEAWINTPELRYAMLSVVRNNWKNIKNSFYGFDI